jgi:hypothetical protein
MGDCTVVAHKSRIDEALTQIRNSTNACTHIKQFKKMEVIELNVIT